MQEYITSLQNPLVKQIRKLQQKATERESSGLFVAEGRREVSLALSQPIEATCLLLCEEFFEKDTVYPVPEKPEHFPVVRVNKTVYNKLAYRENSEGVILVGRQHKRTLTDLQLPAHPLIIVLEGIEKPGNLGAVLRTADAAGVDALLLADSRVDIYNPNAIRASLGCVFTVPVVRCSTIQAIRWFSGRQFRQDRVAPRLVAASLQADTPYYDISMREGTILLFGSEDQGLTGQWSSIPHQPVCIPMGGAIDSLNLSASVAILTFEAIRQRKQLNAAP